MAWLERVVIASTVACFSFACSSENDGSNAGDGDGDGDMTGDGEFDGGDGDGDGDSSGGTGGTGTGSTATPIGTGGQLAGDGDGDSDPPCLGEMCDGSCVETDIDDMNCGACGSICDDMQACMGGTCIQVSCVPELDLCSGSCISTVEDEDNCGSCGTTCGATEICEESTCIDYCQPTESWDGAWTTLEAEVLAAVNVYRASGFDCDTRGYYGPAAPVAYDAALTCAARMHSRDMVRYDYFAHENLDGDGPGPRMDAAGYDGRGWGENISAGRSTAQATVDGWMQSDGHCANIMNPNFTLLGTGYYPGDGAQYGHYWTQNFGAE